MSECIVVTRNGQGDFWLVDSAEEADLHPLVQYGDAIIWDERQIFSNFGLKELPDLIRRLGCDELLADYMEQYNANKNEITRIRLQESGEFIDRIWDQMLSCAKPILSDPTDICNQVRLDRAQTLKESVMTDKKEKKDPAKKKEPKAPKYAPDAKITLLKDKDGNQYGPKNNPKRAGTKSETWFSKYRDGMTVAAYEKALGSSPVAALDYDSSKGFIKVG